MEQQQPEELIETIAETETYTVMRDDQDGEVAYHVQLGGITLHLTTDEWDELVLLVKIADNPDIE